MYIYNITFAADAEIEQEVLTWLRREFLCGTESEHLQYFTRPELMRVLGAPEPGTVSLALHLRADDKQDIENWYADCGAALFADAIARWGDRIVFFPTTLECLE